MLCLLLACVHLPNVFQDLSNVLWALGDLGPSVLEAVWSGEELQAVLHQLLMQLQQQLATAVPQVCPLKPEIRCNALYSHNVL